MESTMGRVLTQITVENLGDLIKAREGTLASAEVRRATADDALVDTGATTLALPTRLIRQLGLTKVREKNVKSAIGIGTASIYEAVRLTIQDRSCTVDVMEVPDEVPILVGQIPLEMLDLVVDPRGCRLTGNPAHNFEWTFELY